MAKSKLHRYAETWTAAEDDECGEDKLRLIRYLLENGASSVSPRSIKSILKAGIFTKQYGLGLIRFGGRFSYAA